MRIGAVANPVMPIFRQHELGFMLNFGESKVFVVPKVFRGFDYEAMARGMLDGLPHLRHLVVLGGEGESSFAARVALKFVTVLEINGSGVQRFDFQDVLFTGMHLDVDVSALRLVGDLRITKTATKEEVKGALTVGFPMGIRGYLQAIFGTIKTNPEVPINTSAQHYEYWMVDGMLYFNPGLMIMTGVGIYGFGGGAYHHMRFIDVSSVARSV